MIYVCILGESVFSGWIHSHLAIWQKKCIIQHSTWPVYFTKNLTNHEFAYQWLCSEIVPIFKLVNLFCNKTVLKSYLWKTCQIGKLFFSRQVSDKIKIDYRPNFKSVWVFGKLVFWFVFGRLRLAWILLVPFFVMSTIA